PREVRLKTLREMEEEYIRKVLEYVEFDKEKAALVLDISQEELEQKLRK
ncbi:MAG: sigma-54-dependent Fis family transcriptional regulator, partial [Candidatus Atribacteria bacterium]|nr:sigma-54-dependent Fis family transcriptional regulator [Candidatus Atribacteria bacterium]MCD6349552.1 sigma-54-dependent Fis family transcriptional regulator [Candidatus Atribacteria bacterium]